MKHALVAVIALVVVATPAFAKDKHRDHIDVRYGQGRQVCAGKPDLQHPAKHWHGARFFFNADGDIREGDVLVVTIQGTSHAFTFGHLEAGTMTLEINAGLGSHTVSASWRDAEGHVKATADAGLTVYDCDAPSL